MDSKQHRIVGMVFLVVFVDLIGFSIIFPLFPSMLEHYLELEGRTSLIGRLVGALEDFSGQKAGEGIAVATLFGGILGSLYSVLQFLFAPIWGAFSDRHGRRLTLLITLSGTALSYVLWIFAGAFWVLILARLVGGIMAGNIGTASAVVGDTTEHKDRARGMGMLGMGIGLGFIVGPAIGGFMPNFGFLSAPADPGAFDLNPFSTAAFMALLLAVVNLVWVARSFPETLPVERRGKVFEHPGMHPFRVVKRLAIPGLRLTSWSYFFYLLAFSAMEFTLAFLAFERLDYTRHQMAWMFVFVGLVMALVQGGLIRRLAPAVGEKRLAVAGVVLTAPGYALVAWAQGGGALYAGLAFMAVGSALVMPCFSALVSRYTPPERQGLALGAFRGAGALSRALGPVLGGLAYWRFGSAATYYAAAAFVFLPAVLALGLPRAPLVELAAPEPGEPGG